MACQPSSEQAYNQPSRRHRLKGLPNTLARNAGCGIPLIMPGWENMPSQPSAQFVKPKTMVLESTRQSDSNRAGDRIGHRSVTDTHYTGTLHVRIGNGMWIDTYIGVDTLRISLKWSVSQTR